MIFNDRPFEERIDAVADAGFRAFEFWGWRDKDLEAIRSRADARGLGVAAIVGSGIQIVDESTHESFLKEIAEAAEAARLLGAPTMIVLTGDEMADRSRTEQHDNVVRALRAAAPIVREAGVRLTLEPLNTLVDHKGYYLTSSREGFEILDDVAAPDVVGLLFDAYHQQVTEGNLTSNLLAGLDRVSHIHVADVPGRREPGTGEVNYMNLLAAAAQAGYSEYCGLEFAPSGDPMEIMRNLAAQLREASLLAS
jgi:hydroxypyruvate isomerase